MRREERDAGNSKVPCGCGCVGGEGVRREERDAGDCRVLLE